MTTQIELGFPLKNIERVSQFANFQVGKKHKDAMINDIQINFLSNQKALVIIYATDKEFFCNIKIQPYLYSYLVSFTRINTDNQNWYSLSSSLVHSILAK